MFPLRFFKTAKVRKNASLALCFVFLTLIGCWLFVPKTSVRISKDGRLIVRSNGVYANLSQRNGSVWQFWTKGTGELWLRNDFGYIKHMAVNPNGHFLFCSEGEPLLFRVSVDTNGIAVTPTLTKLELAKMTPLHEIKRIEPVGFGKFRVVLAKTNGVGPEFLFYVHDDGSTD